MEGLVNYSSEEDREESPKRNVAERCLALATDPYKRSKGDSSRRSKEENVRGCVDERSQYSSHREKDAHNSFRKNSHSDESTWNRFNSGRDNYYRSDRRQAKSYDKRRDTKDERKRRDGHRDREYDHRDVDRERRDRSDRYRRDRHDRERRRKSSDSLTSSNKDRGATNNRSRNRSKSRSPSKEYPSYSKSNVSVHTTETMFTDSKQSKIDQKPVVTTSLLSPSKSTPDLQTLISPPPLKDEAPKMLYTNHTSESVGISLPKYNPNTINPITPKYYNPNTINPIIPKYYNPNIINPTKYAEQVQKRKLIWGSKKSEDTAAKWGHATFSEDSDGKVASKFMRLMGIKSTPKAGATATDTSSVEKTGPDVKSRQAMFSNMEQQYEVARQVTHTMRGVGLGFGSQSRQY